MSARVHCEVPVRYADAIEGSLLPLDDMNASTRAFLVNLERTDWFCNAGSPLDESTGMQPVDGWPEALAICAGASEAYLEFQNELTMHLHFNHRAAYQQWNVKVCEIKPLVIRLVQSKLATPSIGARIPNGAGKILVDTLEWDMLALCIAREYEECIRTRYYDLLERSYLTGRFPCGWIGDVTDNMEGAFVKGKMAVL